MPKKLSILCSTHSAKGNAREINRDFIFTDPETGLFILCGGADGNASQEPASKAAATLVGSTLAKTAKGFLKPQKSDMHDAAAALDIDKIQLLIEQAIHHASHALYEQGTQSNSNQSRCCTLDLLWLLGHRAFTAHIGNGRIYQARKTGLERLTEDHSFKNYLIKKGHSEDAAGKSPYAHILERCMGKNPIIEVDLGIFEVMPGEKIILASDGLFQHRKESELAAILAGPHSSLKETIEALYRPAEPGDAQSPFRDDASVILISIAPDTGRTSARKEPEPIPADQKLAALKSVEFFQPLSYKDVSSILSISETKHYPAGTIMMREGDDPDEFWILLSGTIEVFLGNNPVPILCEETAGKCLGESGILGKPKRRATIRAKTDLTALRFRTETFGALLRRDYAFGFRVMNSICSILSDRTNALNNNLAMNALLENIPADGHPDG